MKTIEVPLITEEPSGVTALLGGQIDLTSTAPFSLSDRPSTATANIHRQDYVMSIGSSEKPPAG